MPLKIAATIFLLFLFVDVIYLSANLPKVVHYGLVTILMCAACLHNHDYLDTGSILPCYRMEEQRYPSIDLLMISVRPISTA